MCGRFIGPKFTICALLVCLITCLSLEAQLPTATILGTIKDATGAVLPGVSLTVTSAETGQVRTTITAEDGSYRVSALPVGGYSIKAELTGFQTAVRNGITLAVSQEAPINFTLEIGSTQETISVTADAPLVNITSASLGGLVDEQKIADLPLNGRNYVDLTLLQPGVTEHKGESKATGISGTWFSVNGAPTRSNNFLLDGAIMQNVYGGNPSSITNNTLGVEGIREYRIVTSFFPAEYGTTMGSQMVIVTKSGTNNFHGSLFEYLRNSALDARNFFDTAASAGTHLDGTPRRLPQFQKNNFGGSIGGPIRKDKTFVFGVYEGIRQRLGVTQVHNVPASGCRGPAGATITNTACPQLGPTVPSVTIAPVIAPLLAIFPEANAPNNVFNYAFNSHTREDYAQGRVDQTFSANDSFFGRYTITDARSVKPAAYANLGFGTVDTTRNQYTTLSETHIFSPTFLNTSRISYSRTHSASVARDSNYIGPQYSFVPGAPIGGVSVGGITGYGTSSDVLATQNIFSLSDDVFLTRGKHSLKLGTLINRYEQWTRSTVRYVGSVSFSNVANFLRGIATSYNAATPGSIQERTYQFYTMAFYAQDDVRLTSRLTLNLGLRYEPMTQIEETKGRGAAFRDVTKDNATTLGPPFRNPTKKNWSPRVGLAWDVQGDGKTAVRAGFGLLYDLGNLGSTAFVGSTATPPFSSSSQVDNPPTFSLPLTFPASSVGRSPRLVDYYIKQPHLLQYNVAIERETPWNTAVAIAYAGSRGINLVRTVEGNPTVPQILSDGREFWPASPCLPLPSPQVNCVQRLNPNWANIEFKTSGGNSWYNAMQVGFQKRLSNGLQFQNSYTWSKMLDITQGQLGADSQTSGVFGTDTLRTRTDKGPADFDVTHVYRFNAIYYLPGINSGGLVGKMFGGWWISGIYSLTGGYPFPVSVNSNRSRSGVNGNNSDRADILPGRDNSNVTRGGSSGCTLSNGTVIAPGTPLGTPNLYFDPCAFGLQAPGFLGNSARNMFRGPGFSNVDFSLVKDTVLPQLGEEAKLQFRVEVFNLLNHPNFGIPNRTVFAGTETSATPLPLPTAGQITTTSGTARQIQFALKFLF
jgi:hypothetical protein